MKTTILILFLIITSQEIINAQDCNKLLQKSKADSEYVINSQSKGLIVQTGKTYNFIINLNKGIDYRLKFFADEKFNKKIKFKLSDKISKKVIFNLPGESVTDKKGTSALSEYTENEVKKHPYFDFRTVGSTILELTITIQTNKSFPGGCFAIMLLNKPKQ